MQQIEHRATPAGELGHEDYIDLAGLHEAEDFFMKAPVIFGRPDAVSFQTSTIL
jgi:hypothetical protein